MKKTLLLLFVFACGATALFGQNPAVCSTNFAEGSNACADACLHCLLDGRTGQTGGYTAAPAPGFCGTVENNVWYAFVAGADHIVISAIPSNCQLGDGIELALYENCSGAPLACAVGQPGEGTTARTVAAALVPGQTYFLMVDGYDGDACSFELTVGPTGAVAVPPVAAAGPIQGPMAVFAQTTLQYAVDAVPGATAYRWEGTGGVQINGQTPPVTLPAPAGQQVSVTFAYQGGTLCAVPLNACGEGAPACLTFLISTLEGLAAPCPTDDYPGADFCFDACVFCSFTGYAGTTAGYTGQTPPGFCGTIENEQWFGFVAKHEQATFTVTPSNCMNGNGVQVALFSSQCNTPPLACNDGQMAGGSAPVSVSASLQPGTAYYLLVDGWAGDICDFTITVDPPDAAIAPPLSPLLPIEGPATACPGAVLNYSVPQVSGAGAYTWIAPPGWKINGRPSPVVLGGPGGHVVQVEVGNTSGQLCVQAANSCYDGPQVCKPISVQPIPITVLPAAIICNEDAPYYTPWGEEVFTSGTYQTTYPSATGCDSTVRQTVTIKAPILRFLPPQTICAGDSVVICGQAYYDGGAYTHICESYQGCDSIVSFSILMVEPIAKILAPQNPLCIGFPVTLNSLPSAGVKTWTRLDGVAAGAGNSVTIPVPGTYILTTTASAGGKFCTATDTIELVAGTPPQATIAPGTIITCNDPTVQLLGASNPPGLLFEWSGPNGFSSSEENPEADQPGVYTLVVTDPATGCTATATTLVAADFNAPIVSLPPAEINCTNPDLVPGCPFAPATTCLWSGPGIDVPIPNPVIEAPGVYTLTLTYPNGCTSTSELSVTADFQVPVITVATDTINCYNPTTEIFCSVDIPGSDCVCVEDPFGACYMVVATAPNGCTSTAEVVIVVDANAPSLSVENDTLRCNQPTVTLVANTNANNVHFAWAGPGGFTSNEPSPTVSEPGAYHVTVTDLNNGCSSGATLDVVLDPLVPFVIIAGTPLLTCATPSVVLQAMTNQPGLPGLEYAWAGPGGFASDQPNPEVDQPGIYIVVVTDPATGCSAYASVEVVQDLYAVTLSVADTLTCAVPSITVDLPQVPGFDPVTLTEPGVYTVEAINPANGCTSTVTITVSQDIAEPEITILEVVSDTFGQGLGAISIAVTHAGAYTVDWFLDGLPVGFGETISGLQGGLYTVVVTGSNGCTATATVAVLDEGVSASELDKRHQWLVFPNPTSGALNLRYLGSDLPETQMLLLDATGRVALEQAVRLASDTSLAVGHLPAGMYTLLIRTRDSAERRLVVVQR